MKKFLKAIYVLGMIIGTCWFMVYWSDFERKHRQKVEREKEIWSKLP